MAGLSPYLTGQFPEDDKSLTPSLVKIMQDMGINAAQASPQAVAIEVPTTPQPQSQAIESVKQQLVRNLPKPKQSAPQVPPEMLEMAKRTDWEDNTKKALAEQDAGIAGLERYIQEYAQQPRQLDLSPLAALSDSMNPGGKLSQVIKAPMSEDERQKIFIDLQDKLQQRKAALSQNALAPYKAQLDAYKDLMRSQAMGGRQERFESGQDVKMFDKARKEQAGFTKDVGDFVNSYRNVENAITPGEDGMVSVGRLTQSLSQFARLMGEKGVLTDTDTGRQLAPTLEVQIGKLESILGSNPNARIPVQNVAAMVDALQMAKSAYKESYNMKAGSFANTYFNNPGSPYAGKEWAPTLVEELYKPLQLIDQKQQTVADPARARLEELRKKRDATK